MELLVSLKYWQWLCKLGMEDQIFNCFFFCKKCFVNGLIDIET